MDKSQYKNVFVFIEQREGVIQNVALELLGKARELADTLNEKVFAMLLGHKPTPYCGSTPPNWSPTPRSRMPRPFTKSSRHTTPALSSSGPPPSAATWAPACPPALRLD